MKDYSRIPHTDGKRSWTGFKFIWRDWWKLWPRYSAKADMNTNYGFNDYEEVLRSAGFGPVSVRWYTLT